LDRLMPRRMTILFGHCVDAPHCNGFLPADMKIRAENLDGTVAWLSRHYSVTSIGDGEQRLRAGRGPSVVALSFDDGYRDNRTDLLPLLERHGARATVFLETRPLDEGVINWSHKYHWALERTTTEQVVRRHLELGRDPVALEGLRAALAEGRGEDRLRYQAKRVLKYDADPQDRDAVIDQIFREQGGDEPALCRSLYMTWEDARALRDAGFELGGHTVNHVILSRLARGAAEAEIRGCREALERELGPGSARTFAYPFGRRWDYSEESRELAREAGFELAVNTHAGVNVAERPGGPLAGAYELKRLPIDDRTPRHLLAAEVCGGFELLRRFGLDLSE
jgi:peptidoglycan/xylan/chitin deacetylase (PgdA/CDA1 family)